MHFPYEYVPEIARYGSAAQYRDIDLPNISERSAVFADWYNARLAHGIWPYNKSSITAPGAEAEIIEENSRKIFGINLASQDYLSLSSHGAVVEAAKAAAVDFGVHSSGSAILMGNTKYSRNLEMTISEAIKYTDILLFPTGWAAGFGVIKGLVRSNDHVVMDALSHNCLQEGARASTQKISLLSHLNTAHLKRTLSRIRAKDAKNAIFVVTEGLFSMDSDTPDIRKWQDICREYSATLIVDVAHDLGIIGRTGRSSIEEASCLGEIDIVVGAFSKTFASNGGFVAVNNDNIAKYLRVFAPSYLFSNALSPIQSAILNEAFRITFSDEPTLFIAGRGNGWRGAVRVVESGC